MEERENKYLKNKNFNFRLGVYIITILIFLGVATFKITSSNAKSELYLPVIFKCFGYEKT